MSHHTVDLAALTPHLTGDVIAPDHPEYESSRTIFYSGFDQQPAAIVRVADAPDVARVVRFAGDLGIELAVKAGGHSLSGFSLSEGGLVVDLSAMKGIDIDPEARTASAQGGVTTGELTTATAEHGLTIGFGDTGSVGIGGITLAGGIGFLVRKYGLTIDNLLGAEIVTADGEIVTADETTNPDLFWAIRGGGGNFGVVTRFDYRLNPVRQIVGGMMALPATPEAITGLVAVADAAPDEFSAILNVMVAPPIPFVPPELHGKQMVMALMAHVGGAEAAEETLGEIRALAEPLADYVGPIEYTQLFEEPEGEEFHPMAKSHNMFIDELDRADAEKIIDAIGDSPAAMSAVQLRVLGGAAARVPVDATAFAHRQRKIMVNIAGMYMDPSAADATSEWVDRISDALAPGGGDAGYAAFVTEEGEVGAHRAYPEETWDRLREIKRKYDPYNLFHRNHNIPPG